jgi:hypothetical protein
LKLFSKDIVILDFSFKEIIGIIIGTDVYD